LSFVDGDVDGARAALEAGIFEGELGGDELVVGHCLGTLAIIEHCNAEEASASVHARRASEVVAGCGGELLPPTAPVMAITALHHVHDGERDRAVQAIAAARRALTGFRTIAPWFNVITRLALVRAVLLLDDRAAAQELMRELRHHARVEPHAPERGALACIDELGMQVKAMHVQGVGASGMTDSELRVLRLLPTNLSLAEIAAQLFVSRNTVKSHVASIYRKLEVDKRGDAVERARSAGLLPTPPH
jgi:LuxR family maltose regulon positive regulatory protein